MNHSDANELHRAQAGDLEAFDALLQPYLERAYRTAYLITRNRDAASDALQEALIRAYRSLGNVTPGHPFYPWFARVVVNEALKEVRRYRSTPVMGGFDVVNDEATPEKAALANEEREQIWQAVQSLSAAHRTVIILRYYEQMSEAEMAAVLTISPGTVKSRLHHARLALERFLSIPHRSSGVRSRMALWSHLRGGGDDE